MIDLFYTNGTILLYKVESWIELRRTHRIIGDIVGSFSHIPSLPMKISIEEALLLLEKGVVNIKEVEQTNLNLGMSQGDLEQYQENLLQSQVVHYKKIRKKQLEGMIDKIVEKRRQRNDTRSAEDILTEELEKSTVITADTMLWPILNSCDTVRTSRTISSDDLLKLTNKLKSLVYSDLWEKGYYVTHGDKFGGDFLVYVGDPICFHAVFIVKCVENDRTITPSEIVAFGRLGTAVKKRAVLASLIDNEISYITINWIDN